VSVLVVQGDARELPLPDASVDLIVTSPPYFGLRSYTDGGEHYAGQIGSEATPAAYLAALVACTREWVRVLKPQGSLFVNLGDKYSTSGTRQGNGPGIADSRTVAATHYGRRPAGMPEKSLLGLPWRYALNVIDQLGLILRAEIIWAKPNGLPESVTDRVRRAHEQVFHFTLRPRYYSAVDEIREPHESPRHAPGNKNRGITAEQIRGLATASKGVSGHLAEPDREWGNPLGKLPGSVWSIPSQPLTVPPHLGVDHFAAFPMELPRRLILGWSPPGVCSGCGEGRRPVTERANRRLQRVYNGTLTRVPGVGRRDYRNGVPQITEATITGYTCACIFVNTQVDACSGTRPAVVLDPFSGTGTVPLVASAYGRIGIGVDRSADYCRIAQWRTTDRSELAKALCVPKPPEVAPMQEPLWA
jgi:DNA modification methylase